MINTETIFKSLNSTAAYPIVGKSYSATIQLSVATSKATTGGQS
jgi:hypothetical protein